MKSRGTLILLAIVVLVFPVAVALVGVQQTAADTAENADLLSRVQVHTLAPGDIKRTVTAIGAIEVDDIVEVGFLRNGRISTVYVDEGDAVAAGDLLAQLANEPERIGYEVAQLNVEIAQLQLVDTSNVDANDIRLAQANVDAALNSYGATANAISAENIRTAELEYERALRAAEAARLAARETGGLDDAAAAELQAQAGEAEFQAEVARLRLDDLRTANNPSLGASAARIDLAELQLEQTVTGATDYQLELAEINVANEQANLQEAELAFERTLLRAPVDAVISDLLYEDGERILAGTPVIELTDIDPIRLVANVDEIDIRDVRVGMGAVVELDAVPGADLPATVTRIASTGERVNGIVSYEIEVELLAADPRIRPGMTAEADITVEMVEDALFVPNRFIDDGIVTLLDANGEQREVEVTTGLRGASVTEVTSGLQAGDVVLFFAEAIDTGLPF